MNNYSDLEVNIYGYTTTLSSNWKGTCSLIESISNLRGNYTNNFNLLNSTLDTSICTSNIICHKNTLNYYGAVTSLISQLNNISYISSTRPSGSTDALILKFESEFQNLSDTDTMGGLIYRDYINNLVDYFASLNSLYVGAKSYVNNYGLITELNEAYYNILNLDKTVASAASIIMTNFINDKKLILNFFQFMFIFIFTGYLGAITVVIILFIIFQCEKYRRLYNYLIGFINLFAFLAIWSIVLSALFQGIRHFVRESPRVMQFLFLEDYILYGNTDSYPPKFGFRDQTMIDFLSTCLNGDGDLFSQYLSKSRLNTILSQTNSLLSTSNNLYSQTSSKIKASNIVTNSYNNIINASYIYSSILKLEEIYNNLYLASEAFGDDDIRSILDNIRAYLDSEYCGMYFEYYVIKKSDCPRYSIILNQITNTVDNIYHCYIIQDLITGTSAQYHNATACGNDYINNAIDFIKNINDILKNRINFLKELHTNYAATFNSMHNEIIQINSSLYQIYNLINEQINDKYLIGNCSSVKFDLIDFSEFMYDTIGYKLKIMIIFSSLSGILGYISFYSMLLILSSIKRNDTNFNKPKSNYNYYPNKNYLNYQPPNKLRNIKPIQSSKNKTDDEKFNYKYNKFNNNILGSGIKNSKMNKNFGINNKDINKMQGDVVYNNVRKIEMKTLNNNDK